MLYCIKLLHMKSKKRMPNKIGVVGRKKLPEMDKKVRVDLWKRSKDIELLGGIKTVKTLISNFIDEQVSYLID